MITIIIRRIIFINLLLIYRLPYFLFCLLVFVFLRANFVIGLWAVQFARI
jgi:hypothetical protein